MLIGASWPWNLSTVPTRASGGSRRLMAADLGVVRRDDEDVVEGHRPGHPVLVRPGRAALDQAEDERRHGRSFLGVLVVRPARRQLHDPRPCAADEGDPPHRRPGPRDGLGSRGDRRRTPPTCSRTGRGAGARSSARNRPRSAGIVARSPEDMGESRAFRARGMRALERLIELLGIPEQDDARRRRGHRDDVRERDLACLIDEQHVHRVVRSSRSTNTQPVPATRLAPSARPSGIWLVST